MLDVLPPIDTEGRTGKRYRVHLFGTCSRNPPVAWCPSAGSRPGSTATSVGQTAPRFALPSAERCSVLRAEESVYDTV
jgi:hypothetical protein